MLITDVGGWQNRPSGPRGPKRRSLPAAVDSVIGSNLTDSKRTVGHTRLPRRAQRIVSLPGSLQAVTHHPPSSPPLAARVPLRCDYLRCVVGSLPRSNPLTPATALRRVVTTLSVLSTIFSSLLYTRQRHARTQPMFLCQGHRAPRNAHQWLGSDRRTPAPWDAQADSTVETTFDNATCRATFTNSHKTEYIQLQREYQTPNRKTSWPTCPSLSSWLDYY